MLFGEHDHMNGRIYLDNAATTPVDERVLEKMLPYFGVRFGNADSVHSFGREAASAVDGARREIAAMLGVRQSEVFFTSCGTESNNWAIKGVADKICKNPGKDRIVTSVIEHASVLSSCVAAERCGAKITYLPVKADGAVDPADLEKAMAGGDVALVSVMAVNNETGVVQPVRELSDIARRGGALFHTDGVQAACSFDLAQLCSLSDMMSLSAHKACGPKGAGVLYVRKGTGIGKLMDGGEQERGQRGGTVNVPAVIGCAAALCAAADTRDGEARRLASLSELFLSRISLTGGITVNGQCRAGGILNVRADGINDHSLLHLLDIAGVACSSGAACSSGSAEPSHVLLAMGLTEGEAKGSVRVSFGRTTTEEETEEAARRFVAAVAEARSRAVEK